MYALDTNTLIYFFRDQGHIAKHLLGLPPAEIAIPAVVLYELAVGIAKSNAPDKRQQQLSELVALTTILPFETRAARESADIRAQLESAGQPIGPMDTLIAGTARAHRAILVTRNIKEFSRVPNLQIENWYKTGRSR